MNDELKNQKRIGDFFKSFDSGAVQPRQLKPMVARILKVVKGVQNELEKKINTADRKSREGLAKSAADLAKTKEHLQDLIKANSKKSNTQIDTAIASVARSIKRVEKKIPELPEKVDLSTINSTIKHFDQNFDKVFNSLRSENLRNALLLLKDKDGFHIDNIYKLKETLDRLKKDIRSIKQGNGGGPGIGLIQQIAEEAISNAGVGVSTFLGLTDTPSTFTGQGGRFPKVNAAEDAIEFVTLAGGGDMLASTYDPDSKAADVYDMDNMDEGADAKIMTAAERAAIAANTAKTSYDDAAAVALNTAKRTYPIGDETKVGHISVTQAVDLDQIEARVNELDAAVVLKGEWDASAGTFPTSTDAGESWIVSVAGTVNSVEFEIGDRIVALTDGASTTVYASNWLKLDYTDKVNTVAGKTGAVTLDADDIAETAGNKILTAGERTKLSGIEAAADVTDAANVTAAGAHMSGGTDVPVADGGTGASNAADARTNLGVDAAGTDNAPAASTTVAGKAELATTAEVNTGSDAGRTVTPDALAGSNFGIRYIQATIVDYTVDVATGDGKFYLHIPPGLNGMNLVYVHAGVITAGTTGTLDIQIRNVDQAADMLSTKATIDSGETGTDTAATPLVIDTANDDVTTGDAIRIDVDAIPTTAPKGLVLTLGFQLP